MPHRADRPIPARLIRMKSPPRYRGPHYPTHRPQTFHPHEAAAMAAHQSRHFPPSSTNPNPVHAQELPPLAEQKELKLPTKKSAAPIPKPVQSKESPEQTAIMALLLAANGPIEIREEQPEPEISVVDPPDNLHAIEVDFVDTSKIHSARPRVKRKKHLDFLRRNGDNNPDMAEPTASSSTDSPDHQRYPCHISPLSNSSNMTNSTAEVTNSTTTSALRTPSYDLKEGQEITTTPDFPSVLHKLLGHHSFTTIVQWLPHGHAWRVLRWDALRNILPIHFPHLGGGNESGGSIDKFLLQVRSWGFEEIKDGPDVGAYCHMLFVRGNADLCRQMRFSPPKSIPDDDSPKTPATQGPYTAALQERRRLHGALLQVPSLASHSADTGEKVVSPPRHHIRDQYDEGYRRITHERLTRNYLMEQDSPLTPPHGWREQPPSDHRFHGDSSVQHYPYLPPHERHPHHHLQVSHTQSQGTWFPFGGSVRGEMAHRDPHSVQLSPRVRSGRGGYRGGPSNVSTGGHHVYRQNNVIQSERSVTGSKRGTVSHRGKGKRPFPVPSLTRKSTS